MRVERKENRRLKRRRSRVSESKKQEPKPDKVLTVSEDFRVPGTQAIIEEGDVIEIFEAGDKKKKTASKKKKADYDEEEDDEEDEE